jgi:hypothetical protein
MCLELRILDLIGSLAGFGVGSASAGRRRRVRRRDRSGID